MSDYLTSLPVELIHKILDNVSMMDIFLSMSLVNKYLRSVCVTYSRYQADFSSMMTSTKKNQFDCICTQLFRSISQIVSLTLFDKTDPLTPTKNALFFSRFNSIDQRFSNLRSLTLTYINYDTWCLFKCRLSSHIYKLSIHLVHPGISRANQMITSTVLNELLLYSSSLKHLSVKMSNYSKGNVILRPDNPTTSSSVQYFHLEDIIINLSSLFAIVPILHILEIHYPDQTLTFNHIHSPSFHLQRLKLDLCSITWKKLAKLVMSFPRLTHLTVIADQLERNMANGFAWTKLLKNIRHFECKLQFDSFVFDNRSLNINSFRTKFWLKEKKWFIIYNKIEYTGCTILYTNSCLIDNYLSYRKIGIIRKDCDQRQSTSFPNISCSILNYQYTNSALLHQLIYISEPNSLRGRNILPMSFEYLYYYLDAWNIITYYSRPKWMRECSYEIIDYLHNLANLRAISVPICVLNYFFLHQWSNIVYLRIEPDREDSLDQLPSTTIEQIGYSFPHIERLDIHLSSIVDLPQLINRMKSILTDLIIRQARSQQSITREWIEQNTQLKNFHYSCDVQNCISLWF